MIDRFTDMMVCYKQGPVNRLRYLEGAGFLLTNPSFIYRIILIQNSVYRQRI